MEIKKWFFVDLATHKSTCMLVQRDEEELARERSRPFPVFDLDFHPCEFEGSRRETTASSRVRLPCERIDLAIWRCANAPANYLQSPPFSDFMPIVCTDPNAGGSRAQFLPRFSALPGTLRRVVPSLYITFPSTVCQSIAICCMRC